MRHYDLRNLVKSDYPKLLLVLALAFYVGFIPHASYNYPVHIDEWVHLAFSQAIQKAGSVTFVDPFYGGVTRNLASNLEAGFQLFWSIFQQISGVSWLHIFRFFPSIIFMTTALAVYVVAKREGFGWEAAFFACLIPTSVGILGPAFLVPVAIGLLFIPLSLFVAFNLKGIWTYLVIALFTSFLLLIHAPSAILLVIILGPYLLLNIRRDFRHSLGITLALGIPFLVPFPWILDLLLPTAKGLATPQPLPSYVSFPLIINSYGYLPISLCLLGTFLLALKGGVKNLSLVLGLLGTLAMLVSFYAFGYGLYIIYGRGLVYMMLMVSVLAGAGLASVKNLTLPERVTRWLRTPIITQYVGKFLCLVLIAIILWIAIPDRQDTPYYHVIDDYDYQAFVWIKENVGKEYSKAILDPWKATAFTALTGKAVFTRLHASPMPADEAAQKFLSEGCSDTEFLKKNGISIVYTFGECHNPDLDKVRENIYLLKKSD